MDAATAGRLGRQNRASYRRAGGEDPDFTDPSPAGYRSVLGLIRLAKTYTPERLEAACRRALVMSAWRLKSVASILKTGLDRQPLPESTESQRSLLPSHDNIRGAGYYH